MLGPDFVFALATGQANAAYRGSKALLAEDLEGWNMRLCFFVNMGGLHVRFADYKPRDGNDEAESFPVTCEELAYLVRRGYIDAPALTEQDVNDRNKADGLGRTISVIQSLWFTISTLARINQGLHITTLEITTLAFVFIMLLTTMCWWRKPMDITIPIVIDVDESRATLATVLEEADAPPVLYGRTPLSFLYRREWFMSHFWRSYVGLLRFIHLAPRRNTPRKAPTPRLDEAETEGGELGPSRRVYHPSHKDHFSSIDFPIIEFMWELTLGGPFIMLYSCIFMSGWNNPFPTTVEAILWRVASLACLGYGAGGIVLVAWVRHSTKLRKALGITHTDRQAQQTESTTHQSSAVEQGEKSTKQRKSIWARTSRAVSKRCWWMRNLTPDQDPAMTIGAGLWIVTTVMCFVYSITRLYVLVEDVVSLRYLPPSAYQTVEWGNYSPIL